VQGRTFNGLYALVIRSPQKAQPNLDDGTNTNNKPRSKDDTADEKAIEEKSPILSSDSDDTELKIQWFLITDIGLATYESPDKLYVAARALSTGKPLSGLDIELVTNGNHVLQKGRTNAQGVAELPARLARGTNANQLAAIVATGGGDFAFIDYTRDTFDMS